MATTASASTPSPAARERAETVADLLARLGDVDPARVRLEPSPGTATVKDVLAAQKRDGSLCELVEGTLVEKPMGFEESTVALWLGWYLGTYLQAHSIGQMAGPDGAVRLFPRLVRIPDVSFVSWERLPKGKKRRGIPALAPDLAVEVLSPSNTPREIRRKLDEYFAAGTRLAWVADPRKRTVRVHDRPDHSTLLRDGDTLDGGDVLPGFRLPLRDWFDQALREESP